MQMKTARNSRIAAFVAAALFTLPLAACSAQNEGSLVTRDSVTLDSAPVEMSSGSAEAQMNPVVSPDASRSVISTGDITVEVSDTRAAVDAATTLVESLGGYVESQSLGGSGSGSSESASLSVRIPSAKFDQAFSALGELGTPFNENRSATDVTAQHVDLQARVESLQTSVTRLNDLMAGAATTSELIEAESALAARQAELDSLAAQLKMLEDQVDESTIWVNFTTKSALPGGPGNFWEGLLAGLNSLTVAGAGALVLLGVLLPWLIIAAIVTVAIVALVRTSRKRKALRGAAQVPQSAQMQQTPAVSPEQASVPEQSTTHEGIAQPPAAP